MSAVGAILYRTLYDQVICRLPEPRAVALGQALLRAVPLDRLGTFELTDPGLAVTLGGVPLPNPLVLAAMYHDPRILQRAARLGFGAVTSKSITRSARPGHPEPNLARVRTAAGPGLVNCNGFQNPGLEAFRRSIEGLRWPVPLIVSVAGETAEDYVALVRALGPYGALVEFNVSSPNTRLVYEWSTRPAELRAMLETVRSAASGPVILKLSPDFADANEQFIIPAAIDAGIAAVNYGNARRVEDPRLSQGAGGLSGPEIFPATLDHVRRTRARFGPAVDVIATGGIDAPDKALAALQAGATAVGYFTGFITRGPGLARRILERLRQDPSWRRRTSQGAAA